MEILERDEVRIEDGREIPCCCWSPKFPRILLSQLLAGGGDRAGPVWPFGPIDGICGECTEGVDCGGAGRFRRVDGLMSVYSTGEGANWRLEGMDGFEVKKMKKRELFVV